MRAESPPPDRAGTYVRSPGPSSMAKVRPDRGACPVRARSLALTPGHAELHELLGLLVAHRIDLRRGGGPVDLRVSTGADRAEVGPTMCVARQTSRPARPRPCRQAAKGAKTSPKELGLHRTPAFDRDHRAGVGRANHKIPGGLATKTGSRNSPSIRPPRRAFRGPLRSRRSSARRPRRCRACRCRRCHPRSPSFLPRRFRRYPTRPRSSSPRRFRCFLRCGHRPCPRGRRRSRPARCHAFLRRPSPERLP
jgi:hypothetical protein